MVHEVMANQYLFRLVVVTLKDSNNMEAMTSDVICILWEHDINNLIPTTWSEAHLEGN
jgi:hypothetical protein